MPEPLRVLHLVGRLEGGGIQNWLLQVLERYDRARFRMDVCAMADEPGPLAPQAEALGSRVWTCPMRPGLLSFPRRLGTILREGGYGAIHVHRSGFGAPALWVARRAGVLVRVHHFHSARDARPGDLPRRLAAPLLTRLVRREATRIVGCSEAALVDRFGPRWREDARMTVLHYGIPVEGFAPDPAAWAVARTELGIPTEALVVGHAGRFSEPKNHALFVEVAARVARELPAARFLLVGDGELRAEIERRIAEAGLADRFVLTGWRTDLPRLLAAMDVFLFPSLWEGLPIAALEAQAAGLPCVVSALPLFDETLAPEQAALRFALDAPADGARLVLELLRDAPRRRALGLAAREFVRERFSIEASVRAVEALYSAAAAYSAEAAASAAKAGPPEAPSCRS